jgi:hypothetical protein
MLSREPTASAVAHAFGSRLNERVPASSFCFHAKGHRHGKPAQIPSGESIHAR